MLDKVKIDMEELRSLRNPPYERMKQKEEAIEEKQKERMCKDHRVDFKAQG